nr:filamentous hemagglutinin family protein [Burkholderia sp. Ac-20353]
MIGRNSVLVRQRAPVEPATGDINAGRGAKTTVVYAQARRLYDAYGNVTLSPTVPSTGAGFATLAPIPGILPGDMNLVAPLGTIDAGEAGIRVSGNLNVAALHVVNAANIQAGGKTTGLPAVASIDTGALTAADAAASAANDIAQSLARGNAEGAGRRRWSISVQVEGFGDGGADDTRRKAKPATLSYDPDSALQVVGRGVLDAHALARLSALAGLSAVERRSVEESQ